MFQLRLPDCPQVINYQPLIEHWLGGDLSRWADILPSQIDKGLSHKRYGDLARWQQAVKSLPDIAVKSITTSHARVGANTDAPLPDSTREQLRTALMGLHPWRKGPYDLFGVHIDTEWRSDLKWDRLAQKIEPLNQQIGRAHV